MLHLVLLHVRPNLTVRTDNALPSPNRGGVDRNEDQQERNGRCEPAEGANERGPGDGPRSQDGRRVPRGRGPDPGGLSVALSEAQVFGFSTNVQELYLKARKPLEDGHVDVDGILADLREAHERAAKANAVQEEAKRRAKETTEVFVPLKVALARKTSSAMDIAIGAVGKETSAAANFRRLRSDIQRATTPEAIAAVSPVVPEPVTKP